MTTADNPWTTLGTERCYDDSFISVDRDRVINPAGRETEYGVVRFKNRGLKILAIDDEGCTFLVQQWRYGASYLSWELPAGGQEAGEDEEAGAQRELREETGRVAHNLMPLLELVPSGSITDQRDKVFVAWDLSQSDRDLDEQERIRVRRLPFAEAVEMALRGDIGDSGTIAGLLAVEVQVRRGVLPSGLQRLFVA